MDRPIRVLIADDHAGARRGLQALLSTRSTMEVVCEAQDGREAVQRVEEYQPDVVLMDLHMPEWDGLEATRHIKARWPEVRVIALTIRATYQAAALSAGADAFLLKGCPSKELFAAIQCCGTPQPKTSAPQKTAQSHTAARNRADPKQGRLAAAALPG
jgi:NarL family two-component system response regulator LiaR